MSINFASAVGAYMDAAKVDGIGGSAPRSGGQSEFGSMVREAATDAMNSLRGAERMSVKAASNDADVLQVIEAVNSAELTLQTVVAVRDRVIQSYQDIMRMPI